ncbi:MAG TPA: hypothetical protein DEQ30_01775 [Porphyromonadaceae bacterium]|nr:hypothetical protein [Porphyromonadaceae bacterium]
METFIYLLKVNVAIAICYFIYKTFYGRDTFFSMRRYLLQGILVLSALYPLIDVSQWMMQSVAMTDMAASYKSMLPEIDIYPSDGMTSEAIDATVPFYSFTAYFLWFYFAVTCILLVRILFRVMPILWLRLRCEFLIIEGIHVWRLNAGMTPFSFFSWIFIDPDMHDENELHEILAHETVHVRQYHSADVLLAEFFCALFWLNPMSWMIKKEIRKNLEFIVDNCVINEDGIDIKSYQYHLLKQAYRPSGMTLANRFNISPLKERIMMINVRKSPGIKRVAYTFVFPLILLFPLLNNIGVIADKLGNNEQIKHVVEEVSHMIVSDLSPETVRAGIDPVMGAGNVAVNKMDYRKRISGVILDKETQQPLSGVNIIVHNASTGTITDADGRFTLLINEGDTLKISYIGYSGFTLVARNLPLELGILEMLPERIDLDEIYVVGYAPMEGRSEYVLSEVIPAMNGREDENPDDTVFVVVEKTPEFPGGERALLKYIAEHINYPATAAQKGIQGRVSCVFVVNADGTIGNVRVVRSVDPALDNEAIRVINSMPAWTPGEQRGKKVAVQYAIPVHFRMSQTKIKNEPGTIKFLYGKFMNKANLLSKYDVQMKSIDD